MRPRGRGNAVAAVLFVANALDALARSGGVFHALVPVPGLNPLTDGTLGSGVTFLSFAALILLPLVYPRRRVSPRRERLVFVAIGGLFAVAFVFGVARQPAGLDNDPVADLVGTAFFQIGFAASAVVGTLLFLDAFLASRGAARAQVQFFLAAMVAKSAFIVGAFRVTPPRVTLQDPLLAAVHVAEQHATLVLVSVGLAAVPLALLAEALRARGAARPLGPSLFVLTLLGVGFAMGRGGVSIEYEFLLLRPMLLVAGILGFQLLDVESRPNRAVLAGAVLAAVGALFALATRSATEAGADPGLAVSAAFLLTLGVGGALSFPLLRLLLPGEGAEARRLVVYRTALDAASREDGDDGAFEALRPLRQELGISDREHAAVLADGPGPRPDGALRPGTLFLGRYRVLGELGRGGSGEVYHARDERLGREVAVKRLADHLRRDAAALQLFQREMRLASALQHPNVVAVHDVETVGNDAYLVMEFLPGGSLRQRLEAGPMPEAEAIGVARDVLAALGALHARGIVHRDVKPSNVLLDRAGRAKLGDFTVARASVSGETVGFTQSAGPVGTPAWMAPEQARGVAATARSDLYSAAATLYATLAGRPPVEVGDLGEFEARLRVVTAAPALPLPGVSGRTNAVLARALAKDAADRFASAEEMARALG